MLPTKHCMGRWVFVFVCTLILTACAAKNPVKSDADPGSAIYASWDEKISEYECLEVEIFFIDRNDFSSIKLERVAAIPDEALDSIQHSIIGEITRANVIKIVRKTGECEGKTLVFGGRVTDYKKGSRAARILISFGAGKQKFEVQSYLKDKETEQILAKKKIVDRKWGGWAGGDEAKGLRDFAQKVEKFVRMGK